MSKKTNPRARVLREQKAQYVVGAQGKPVAVLLALEEYNHYLDLLDDEADSQNLKLAARLAQAAVRPAHKKRQSFRDYIRRREVSRGQVPG